MVVFQKERTGTYNKLQLKKIGLFRVTQVLDDNAYLLELPKDLRIFSIFKFAYLFPYLPPDLVPTIASELVDEFSNGGKELMGTKV